MLQLCDQHFVSRPITYILTNQRLLYTSPTSDHWYVIVYRDSPVPWFAGAGGCGRSPFLHFNCISTTIRCHFKRDWRLQDFTADSTMQETFLYLTFGPRPPLRTRSDPKGWRRCHCQTTVLSIKWNGTVGNGTGRWNQLVMYIKNSVSFYFVFNKATCIM